MRHTGELRRQPALELPAPRVAALAALLALACAAPATAQTAGSAGAAQRTLTTPRSYDEPPAGWSRAGRAVIARARTAQDIADELAERRGEYVRAFQVQDRRWQVSWYVRSGDDEPEEVAQAVVDDRTGEVLEAWTGPQVAWTMARGHDGAFGREANALYVWLPLCLAFLLPFLRSRPRMLHLDLAVLLSFSVSYALFGAAEIGWSVPLVYPPLLYLLARAAWVARRGPPPAPATWMSADLLAIGAVFLVGFRVGLNVVTSNVIDVGYAGVIGADLIAHGEALYGGFPADNEHGDTYGPVAYLAYLPFELIWPFRGEWDDLEAAHGAAVAFDLATALALWVLGRRQAGAALGWLLAYLWLAFPFSLLVSNSNANDSLVGALLVAVLLAHARPAARGALTALAGLTKFAPLALAPLLARPGLPRFAAAFVVTAVAVTVPAVAGGGLDRMWERTLGFQDDRGSPFSVWGLWDLGGLQDAAEWVAVAFAVAAGFLRRAPGLPSLAAMAAAVLIALQLAVSHWFYLYLVWFTPLLLVALVAAPARSPSPAAAPRSG